MSADGDNREFVLARLRIALLRAKMVANEIEFVGVSLRAGMIDTQTAIEWLAEVGALGYVADMERFDTIPYNLGRAIFVAPEAPPYVAEMER